MIAMVFSATGQVLLGRQGGVVYGAIIGQRILMGKPLHGAVAGAWLDRTPCGVNRLYGVLGTLRLSPLAPHRHRAPRRGIGQPITRWRTVDHGLTPLLNPSALAVITAARYNRKRSRVDPTMPGLPPSGGPAAAGPHLADHGPSRSRLVGRTRGIGGKR
jgi:hypothetical protein